MSVKKVLRSMVATLAMAGAWHSGWAASTWIVPSGNWTTPTNWSGSTLPNVGTDAQVDNGGTILVSSGAPKAADLYLGFTGTGSGTLNMTNGTLTTNSAFIGSGTAMSQALISFGTWNLNSTLVVGNLGQGSVMMTGGLITDVAAYIGNTRFGSGSFTITAGSWRNQSLYVGQVGIGVLTIAATGNVQVTGADSTLYLASGFGSVGTLNIGTGGQAGSLQVSTISAGLGAATVNFNHTGTYTMATTMTGSMAVNKLGLGTTVLTGSNSYSGVTTITSGTLQVGAGGAVGTLGTGNVQDNGSLVFSRTGLVSVTNAISGTGSLTTFGTGTIALLGNNNYTGTTSVLKGVLQVDTNGRLGGSTLLVNGGTLQYGAAFNDLRGFGIGTSGATVDTNGFDVFMTNSATGTGALTKIGAGLLTLTGTNTYTGVTTISSGTLRVGDGANDGTLGMGAVVNKTALVVARATGGTMANAISGAGSLSQIGPGTLTLSGANSYTGGTTLTNGGIRLGSATALGATSGSLTLTAGTLDLNGYNLTVGALSGQAAARVTSNGLNLSTLTASSAVSGTFAGSIMNGSGTVALVKLGSGTLTLTGSSSFTGGSTLTAGTVNLNHGSALGAGLVTMNGASINNTTGTDLTLAANNAQKWSKSFTFLGSNNLNLGTGSVLLSNNEVVTVLSNTLTVGGAISAASTSYSLTKSGTGTLLLTGSSSYGGTTAVSQGLLQVGNNGTSGSLQSRAISLSANGQVGFSRTDNVTVASAISGNGLLRQMSTGTLTLTGTNTYAGGTIIEVGTIRAGNSRAIGGGKLSIAGGVLDLNGFSASVTAISGSTGAMIISQGTSVSTLTTNMNATTSFNGVIAEGTGKIGLVLGGSGTLALNGNNAYSGGTTLNAGELDLGNAHAIGTGTLTLAGGALGNSSGGALTLSTNNAQRWNGNFAYKGASALDLGTGNVLLNGTRAVTVSSSTLTVGGVISGAASSSGLVKSGTGTLILTGSNTYTGATTVSQGVLQLGTGGVMSTLATSGIANNGTLIFNLSNTLFYRGLISGSGSLRQNGTGLLFLSGANSYTGGTVVNSGTLRLGNLRALGSPNGSLQIAASGVVEVNGGSVGIGTLSGAGTLANFGGQTATLTTTSAVSSTFSGVIADNTPGSAPAAALALVKAGAGTLVLSGNNTYSGGTTITAGKLQLGNGGATGTIFGNVANSGILAFNYGSDMTFGGTVSGRGSLQQMGAGTVLTLTGNNTYTGGTTIGAGASLKLVDGSAFGTGAVTDNGTLILRSDANVALANTISGVGGLVKDRFGVLTLNGANSFSGGTVIKDGVVKLGNARGLGASSGNLTVDAGALDLNSFNLTVGALSGTGATASITNSGTRNVTLTVSMNSSLSTFAGSVNDGVGGAVTALVKAGSGTLALTGVNGYSGGTTISGGALSIGDGVTTGVISLDIVNNGVLIFNQTIIDGFDAKISGVGSVVQAGSAIMVLSGSNTYSGGTVVKNGTLQVGNDAALGRGGATLQGGTLATDGVQHVIKIGGSLVWDSNAKIALTLTPNADSEYVSVAGGITLQGNSSLEFVFTPVGLSPGHTSFLVMTVAGGFGGLTPANFSFTSSDPGFEGTFRVDGNNLWFDDGYEPGGGTVDSLTVGVQAVPEPGTWALLLAGGVAVWAVRRRRVA